MSEEREKKPLRQTMTAFENFLTVLMPLSVTSASFLVATATTAELCNRVAAISAFYGCWAVYNVLTTKPQEKGHYPLFLCMLGCLSNSSTGRYVAIFGGSVTWLFFIIAGKLGVLTFPASKLAYVSKKTLYWALVVKTYFVASLLLWAYIVYRLATWTP
eukprot:TRINITY_DN95506_c0_g1_i1.p1 TRINITY_DN95506_c0_g1~~TRINITY_DN95506_c0_g1_i1.p1  ORF type:complete len:159 (-),score=17.92 TRINITY_DN95506_c0_g1_i1:236-712(-)